MNGRQIGRIAEAVFDAKKYEMRTHVIAQVTDYDADTNTVTVQPVTKAIRLTDPDNLTTVELPQISEVPVIQVGSGKLWCTVAPAVDTYGVVHISDRIIDDWMIAGGIVDPSAIRCHDLSDAIFEPSLLPLAEDGDNGKLAEPVATDRISLRTRSGLTEISVLDDESVEVNVNDGKASVVVDLDGNISVTTQGDASVYADGDIDIEAAGNVSTDATETVIQAGTDYAVQYTALKSAFDTLKSELNALVTAYNAHIHITTATIGLGPAVGVIATTTSAGTPPTADMSGSKVSDVRLP